MRLYRAVATGPVGPVLTGPLSGAPKILLLRDASRVQLSSSRTCELSSSRAMAESSLKASLPSLPDKPHHPKEFAFPKRTFGKSKPVLCSAKSQWFDSWPFLHYDEGQDVVFCHTCVTAFKLDRMKTSNNAASAFVSICQTWSL